MSWRRLMTIVRRTVGLPARVERELDDEIRFHLAEEERLLAERGLASDDARAAASRAFGNVPLARETTRAVWVSTRLEQVRQDLRMGSRILTRSPGISAAAISLVALVIGGNTTVFTIAHGILAKPSPGVHASGLVTVNWMMDTGYVETHNSLRVHAGFVERSRTLQPIAAFESQRVTLLTPAGSVAGRAGIVSPNYFETLGARLVHGRVFGPHETELHPAGLAVVISHHLWQTTFEGRAALGGQPVLVNGRPATIVGVAEPEFRGALMAENADLWLPLAAGERSWLQPGRSGVNVMMIGRLVPGVTRPEAQAEVETLWSALQQDDPDLPRTLRPNLVPYSATAGGNSVVSIRGHQILAIFSIVTLLTVSIVCANVANLLIARAATRERETALRQSLGASRGRIIRSLLAEGLVLSLVAWVAACLFAWWVSKVVVRFLVPPGQGPIVMPDLTPDWTVVGYALGLALVCTMAVTMGPALRAWRQPLLPFLKVGEPGVVQGRSRLSRALVVVQLAFSILLLTTAGLAYRSLSLAADLDVGFETTNIMLATVRTSGTTGDPVANRPLLDALQAAIARLPEVDHVSYASGGARLTGGMRFPLRRDSSAEPVMAAPNRVAPGFFVALGVPLVAGRDFTRDDGDSQASIIVTRAVADALWPGQAAVGQSLLAGEGDRPVHATVVGVVRDAHFNGRGVEQRPRYVFLPDVDRPAAQGETTFYVRHRGDDARLGPALMRALRDVDPRVPVASLRTLDDQIAAETTPIWMLSMLLTIFAAGSLAIATIGHNAVTAFDARRRTREFGLRIALGASAPQLLRSVVRDSFRLTAIGLGVGFVLSAGVATVLARVLYGVTPTDPPTYLGVFALLTVASIAASYLPARRAARTDPLEALRTE